MTPPKPGATAAEVIAALLPVLEKTADKEDMQALTLEFRRLNGTVSDICIWRGAVNERHRQEDEQPPAPPPPTEKPAPPEITASPTIALLNLVLGWVLRFMLATAAIVGAINLSKLVEFLPK